MYKIKCDINCVIKHIYLSYAVVSMIKLLENRDILEIFTITMRDRRTKDTTISFYIYRLFLWLESSIIS